MLTERQIERLQSVETLITTTYWEVVDTDRRAAQLLDSIHEKVWKLMNLRGEDK